MPAANARAALPAWVCAGLMIWTLGYSLYGLPVQLTDSFGNIAKAERQSFSDLLYGEFFQQSFLRPFLWAHLKVLLELSREHYFEWFRTWHVLQFAILAVMHVRLLLLTAPSAAVVPLGLAALVGSHTFTGTVDEAFPVNTFMTILLCTHAAAVLAFGPARRWHDVAAAGLLVFAALTVESGLLVAVVIVAARLAGARGVSTAGAVAQVALVAGYLVLRFLVLDVGTPSLTERSSGFGFSVLDPGQLTARFGGSPLGFYAYNVASALASVLFAEPRGGVWRTTAQLTSGGLSLAGVVGVVASAGGTVLIASHLWRGRVRWRTWSLEPDDRIVTVFLALLLANATLSFAYSKDVIMSPAGAFFALALAAAARRCLQAPPAGRLALAGLAVALLVLSAGWAARVVHVHGHLRAAAEKSRNDWAYVDQWVEEQGWQLSASETALKLRLQHDALTVHPGRAPLHGALMAVFDDD